MSVGEDGVKGVSGGSGFTIGTCRDAVDIVVWGDDGMSVWAWEGQ